MSLRKTLWRAGELANDLGYYYEAGLEGICSTVCTVGALGALVFGASIEIPVLLGAVGISYGLAGVRALLRRKFNKDMFRLTEKEGAPSIKTSDRWFDENLAQNMPLVEGLTMGAIGATAVGFGAVAIGLPLTLGVGAVMLGSAIATGAVSYLITKAEVSQYEALGNGDPKLESNCWFGAKILRFLGNMEFHPFATAGEVVTTLAAQDTISRM
ncbi:hypothetical protein JW962_00900 [Candidatus Dojkabacteria bacterium]|nr:hypothetical protein [Candidatus Dojkabacteria bacterium]